MLNVHFGNVLLKPSQRRQLMASLRRTLRLGGRLGDFFLKLTLRRTGRNYEFRADVRDRVGTFACRTRESTWAGAVRRLVHELTARLHEQTLARAAIVRAAAV